MGMEGADKGVRRRSGGRGGRGGRTERRRAENAAPGRRRAGPPPRPPCRRTARRWRSGAARATTRRCTCTAWPRPGIHARRRRTQRRRRAGLPPAVASASPLRRVRAPRLSARVGAARAPRARARFDIDEGDSSAAAEAARPQAAGAAAALAELRARHDATRAKVAELVELERACDDGHHDDAARPVRGLEIGAPARARRCTRRRRGAARWRRKRQMAEVWTASKPLSKRVATPSTRRGSPRTRPRARPRWASRAPDALGEALAAAQEQGARARAGRQPVRDEPARAARRARPVAHPRRGAPAGSRRGVVRHAARVGEPLPRRPPVICVRTATRAALARRPRADGLTERAHLAVVVDELFVPRAAAADERRSLNAHLPSPDARIQPTLQSLSSSSSRSAMFGRYLVALDARFAHHAFVEERRRVRPDGGLRHEVAALRFGFSAYFRTPTAEVSLRRPLARLELGPLLAESPSGTYEPAIGALCGLLFSAAAAATTSTPSRDCLRASAFRRDAWSCSWMPFVCWYRL